MAKTKQCDKCGRPLDSEGYCRAGCESSEDKYADIAISVDPMPNGMFNVSAVAYKSNDEVDDVDDSFDFETQEFDDRESALNFAGNEARDFVDRDISDSATVLYDGSETLFYNGKKSKKKRAKRNGETPEQTRERFARKSRQYARRVKSGQWPGDTCKDCAGGACCKRTWHHSGDLCAHCGLDERGGGMKFRKNGPDMRELAGYHDSGEVSEIDWENFEKGPNERAAVWKKAGAPDMLLGRETDAIVERKYFEKKRGARKNKGDVTIHIDMPKAHAAKGKGRTVEINPGSGKEVVPIERVLKTFGIKDADDLIERNHEFILEMSRPENGDLSEDQVEEAALKAEQQVTDSIYEAWKRSLDRVFDQVADDVGVRLLWRPTGDVTITSEVDWKTAAKKLRDVIHGVGMFAVAASELRTPKRFVLDHWASASAYPDVYGGTSYARLFERDLEGNLRNL